MLTTLFILTISTINICLKTKASSKNQNFSGKYWKRKFYGWKSSLPSITNILKIFKKTKWLKQNKIGVRKLVIYIFFWYIWIKHNNNHNHIS